MMRGGFPTCWESVQMVKCSEHVTLGYLKPKNSRVFGKGQKHVSNCAGKRAH